MWSLSETGPPIEEIRAAAEAFGVRLGAMAGEEVRRDSAGLEWAHAYVEALRGKTELRSLLIRLGGFLGECLIGAHGGEWEELDHEWAVRLENGCLALPFYKAELHLTRGPQHSVLSYFDEVGLVLRIARELEES